MQIHTSCFRLYNKLLTLPGTDFSLKQRSKKNRAMASYLLLRNNRQSGPFSLEQLLQIGFKPYDLIWVEGKSAAWRYPSEIGELKEYAPSVEEQPYDRFYKKPTGSASDKFIPEQHTVSSGHPLQSGEKKIQKTVQSEVKNTAAKHVFVEWPTLPTSVAAPAMEKPAAVNPLSEKNKTDEIPEAEIRFSQSLDDIKDMYVQTVLDRNRKKSRVRFQVPKLKNAALFILIAGFGVIAGFALKADKKSKLLVQHSGISQPQIIPAVNLQHDDFTVLEQKESTKVQSGTNTERTNPLPQNPENKKTTGNLKQHEAAPLVVQLPEEQKQSLFVDPQVQSPGTEINSVTGERSKKVREVDTEIPIQPQKTLVDYSAIASVKSNDYFRAAFGGIRNLELTVTNYTNAILDEVIVELQYLKPNEQPLKTENIRFHSIPAGGEQTIAIPPTNRGVKVAYKIINVVR
jgi:hypothetical protein